MIEHRSPFLEAPVADKLELAWRECRAQQPGLMDALARLCRRAKERGFRRWSVGALFEVLRWETGMSTGDLNLKVNNNHRALAARDLMAEYPDLAGFFETRERKARGHFGQMH